MYKFFFKRLFDLILSFTAILILSPLLIPVILGLLFTGEHYVFYFQERIGFKNKKFNIYKFATMLKNSPNMATGTVTVKNDPRVLPIGKFLRKTKINELPQLFNVFRGDMSIIGPRPQTQRCFDAFPSSSKDEIIKVRPGLSGIGSIIFRDEEDMMHISNNPDEFYDEILMPYKGSLEEWYVSHQNLYIYFSLIGLTVIVVTGFNMNIVFKLFKNLPLPPKELEKWI